VGLVDEGLTGAGIASAVIIVLTAIWKIVREWQKDRHTESKETHVSTLAETIELADKWKAAYEESRVEVHGLRDKLSEAETARALCEIEGARRAERIAYLEELLGRHATDLKFRRWRPDDSGPSIDTTQG
jgi:ABC-type nickel/cobalt efflux system permease component RcnA